MRTMRMCWWMGKECAKIACALVILLVAIEEGGIASPLGSVRRAIDSWQDASDRAAIADAREMLTAITDEVRHEPRLAPLASVAEAAVIEDQRGAILRAGLRSFRQASEKLEQSAALESEAEAIIAADAALEEMLRP